jgi:hypothetical protein
LVRGKMGKRERMGEKGKSFLGLIGGKGKWRE